MADDRLSKTDELAEMLDVYREKKRRAAQEPPTPEPPAQEPPTPEPQTPEPPHGADRASARPSADGMERTVGLSALGGPGSEPWDGMASPDVSSHFSEADPSTDGADFLSSHFSDGEPTDEPADEPTGEPTDEPSDDADDEEEPKKPLPLRIFLGFVHFLSNSSFLLKAVLYLVLVGVVSAFLSYHILTIANDMFALDSFEDTGTVTVTIPENATAEQVTDELFREGLIESEWAFGFYLDHYRDDGEDIIFLPGEHTLGRNLNYAQLLAALTVSRTERQTVTLTFPEGFTVDEIIDLFVSNGVGTREGFVEAINNYPYKHEFVRLLDEEGWPEKRVYRLEGYLYPDTYDFYTDTEEYLAINKLLNNFNDKVWSPWKTTYAEVCAEQGLSLDQIVTLASMVQAEGKTAEDFEYISYVFHNRLAHASDFPKLESDATIQYAYELAGLDREQDASKLNIDFDSPYNTYRFEGLPPGAICSAGLDAFLAAVYPSPPLDENEKEINAFFFVSNNAGKTYYAATVSAHERNKQRVAEENAELEKENQDQPLEPTPEGQP